MKRTVLGVAMLLFALSLSEKIVAEDFKPSGSPTFRIYTNYHNTFSDGNMLNNPAFEITRAYLGYKHKFSSEWSGNITLDVGNPEDGGKLDMTAYLKYGFMAYKKDKLSIDFGLIESKQYKHAEDNWGYRYIYKSFQDEYKFGPSADIGVSAEYELSDLITIDGSIYNGEGYKKMESDGLIKYGLGLSIFPIKNLEIRGYLDWQGRLTDFSNNLTSNRQSTGSLYAGYSLGKLTLGADFDYQSNNGDTAGKDFFGYSGYSTYKINTSSKVFARYDYLNSNKLSGAADNWNVKKDGQLVLLGYEISPVKGIKISPNYQGWVKASDGKLYNTFFVNAEIRF